MPGIYSRNPYTIPQQGQEDPFAVDYFQPAEILPVQYGSTAGGQAVRNSTAFANPGYGPSRLDRYAGDAKGYGNGSMGYEDGLQLDQEGIGKYYDTVNKLNDLSLKAEHLGFNIKKPDFRDQLQRQMFQEYQQHLQDAQTRVMTLKHGKALQDEVRKAYVEGKVFNPQSPEYNNQGTFTDQNFANSVRTVVDPASEDFNKYNAKTYDDKGAYDIAHTRRTGLVQVEQQVIEHANAILNNPASSYNQKQAALADKHEAEQNQLRYAQPTYDASNDKDRAQKERLAKEKDDNGGNELLLRGLFQLHNNNFEYDTDGVLKNKDFTGAKLNVGNQHADIKYITKDPKTGILQAVVTTTTTERDKAGQTSVIKHQLTVPVGNLKQLGLRLKEDNKETYGSKRSFGDAIRGYESANNEIDFNKLFPQNALSNEQKGALDQQAQQSALLPEENGTPEVLNNMLENAVFGKQRQDALNQQYNEAKRQALGQGSSQKRTVVKQLYSAKANKTKFVYSDGSEEIVAGNQTK